MQRKASSRVPGLDLAKALAIFLVVWYHGYTAPVNVADGAGTTWLNYAVYSAMCICVPLFFMVNGYLLLSRAYDAKKHLRRTLTLVVVTIIWQVITLVVLMLVRGERLGVGDLLRGVLYGKQGWTDHFWFMGSLVVLYLFFPLIKAAYDHVRSGYLFFTVAVLVLTFGNTLINMLGNTAAFLVRGTGFETENFFSMFNPFFGMYGFTFGYFLLGGMFIGQEEKVKRLPTLALLAVIVIGAFGQTAYGIMQSTWRKATWDSVFSGYDTFFAWMMSMAVFILCLRYTGGGKIGKGIACIGENTLGIYLWQGIFVGALRPTVKAWAFANNLPFTLVFAVLLFALSFGMTLVLRRIPGAKRLLL